ncbi:hypothetical protein RKD22_000190 [Streptomyces pristinaespiralis]
MHPLNLRFLLLRRSLARRRDDQNGPDAYPEGEERVVHDDFSSKGPGFHT